MEPSACIFHTATADVLGVALKGWGLPVGWKNGLGRCPLAKTG